MPFDFPTTPPGDGADDLPAELAPLAGRLAREADRLAERYPAAALREHPQSSARRRHRWALAALAATLLLAAGIGSVGRWIEAPAAAPQAQSIAARGAAPLAASATSAASTVRPQSRSIPAPRFLPAASFHKLSAPQQEAVLDLLEEGDQELTRLSI